MTNETEVPAFFFKCACKTKDCPNQILWINKENLIHHAKDNEVGGCIPIANFTPEELNFLEETFFEMK